MIEMGILTGLGLIIILAKSNWKWRMRMLSNPVKMDIIVFILLFALHGPGTVSGAMIATIGALMVSLILMMGRKAYGYIEAGKYQRGMMDVSRQVMA
jgi:hypothetical protein